MKPHVITGGPCVGKTTTIRLLRQRGYSVIPEASRMIIEEETVKRSNLVPWKNIGPFQAKVADRQIELEKNGFDKTTFLDRGLIDGYAYCMLANASIPDAITLFGKERYGKVFILEPLNMYVTDVSRVEDEKSAVIIHSEIKKAYQTCGYELISIPPLNPDQRVDFILKHLS